MAQKAYQAGHTKAIDMRALSEDVYSNDSTGIPGYPRLTKSEIAKLDLKPGLFNTEDDKSGFYAAIYKNQKRGGYAVAMRGTEPDKQNDIIADIRQGIGLSEPQYDKAHDLASELLKNPNLHRNNTDITGHSLGGGLAATVGSITGYPTTTYNAAGVHEYTMKKYGISNSQTKHTQAYSSEKDPLNTIQDNRVLVISGARILAPPVGTAASITGSLPKAIGNRIKVPTDDSYKSGHNTTGMKKTLEETLRKK